jgi:hypothetical protein
MALRLAEAVGDTDSQPHHEDHSDGLHNETLPRAHLHNDEQQDNPEHKHHHDGQHSKLPKYMDHHDDEQQDHPHHEDQHNGKQGDSPPQPDKADKTYYLEHVPAYIVSDPVRY